MKLIKKIAAIMLSVMMVLGMASVVSADEGGVTAPTGNGKITITNAKKDQTYTIYRILELESYDKAKNNYAYKAAERWKTFLETESAKAYLTTDSNGGVTWKTGIEESKAAAFAKLALTYAKNNSIVSDGDSKATANGSITFDKLPLGYYLVDSSAGALCSLNTTATEVEIQEKNGVPSVEKKVEEDSTNAWDDSNTADIGQTVNFQTTITAQQGAQNYVLHDKMEAGLTFGGTVTVTKNGENVDATNYTLKIATDPFANVTDGCTFEIVFTQPFCDTLKADEQIIVTYSATLNEKAAIAGEENKNTTKLTYGDSSETTPSTTTTKTFEMSVFKYTKDGTNDKALAGATFTLSKDDKGTNPIKLVSVSNDETNGDTYRVAKENEAITSVTTTKSGKFKIQGLDADIYYLTETQQPTGYNKLSAPIKIKIDDAGAVFILKNSANGTETPEAITDYVKVLNNTGTILPTTGGNGTSLIYFLGAVLALVSGVVLITKQRMKNS